MKPGSEVFHEHYGVYGKVMSDKPFVICGEFCIRVDFGGMPDSGAYRCVCFVMYSKKYEYRTMDWGGISCALVCAIPIVAIICDTVKKVFEIKYKKGDEN